MRTAIITLLTLMACMLVLQDTSSGHGGQWIPPNDIVPPNLLGPGAVTPPSSQGPSTPGPVGPTTAGPKFPGIGPGTGTNLGPRGSATGGAEGKRNAGGEGFERWEFWWENNKWPYLDLRSHLDGPANYSGSSGFLGGRGQKWTATTARRITPEILNAQVIPSLKASLQEKNADILDSAVLALARIVEAEDAGMILDDMRKLLKSTHSTVQQSATLSMGVLDSHQAIPYLCELLTDSREGHRLAGRQEVPEMVRAFAALSLGLINTGECAEQLMRVVRLEADRNREVKVCAVIALGIMKNNEKQDEIVSFLTGLMGDTKLDAHVRAAIPTSLGKLKDPVALSAVMKSFKTERRSNLVVQSCAIAMGLLATVQDREAVDLLMKYIADGDDEQARHFAFIALGQIGAREQGGPEERTTQEKIHKFLLKNLMNSRHATHLPWAALGAALHARERAEYQATVIDKLVYKFQSNKNPSYRGAMAIALGLLNARSQAEMLFEVFGRTNENLLKGHICVALGMMDYKPSIGAIRDIVASSNVAYRLRLEAATALGLMEDTEAVHLLIKTLKENQTMCVTSSAVKALGLIGDRTAVIPLRDILEDRQEEALTRAFSAVALGIIGEKTNLPWNSVISESLNYRAMVGAIQEVLDIL